MAGKDIDIRLSTVPIQNGERIVMRVLEKSGKVLQLKQLGYGGKVLKDLDELSKRKHGILYVCGPTGSGKTTTLFAVIDRINSPDKMIITVEDPVEYEIPGVSQIQANSKIDLTLLVPFGLLLDRIQMSLWLVKQEMEKQRQWQLKHLLQVTLFCQPFTQMMLLLLQTDLLIWEFNHF